VLGENGEPKQLNLSPSLLTSGFIAMVGLLFPNDLGETEATLEHASLVVNSLIRI